MFVPVPGPSWHAKSVGYYCLAVLAHFLRWCI